IANPSRDFDRAPIGPLQPLPVQAMAEASAALQLARSAGLLPALWLIAPATVATRIALAAIDGATPQVELVSRAKLPLDGLPDTQVVAFRSSDDGHEHVALVIGAFGGQPPLVRLHSECLTGDVFGSLKC